MLLISRPFLGFDKIALFVALGFAFLVVPFLINDYWANAILFAVFDFRHCRDRAQCLTGYCGQVSLQGLAGSWRSGPMPVIS